MDPLKKGADSTGEHGLGESVRLELSPSQSGVVAALGKRLRATASVARGVGAMALVAIVPTVLLVHPMWGAVPLLFGLYLFYVARRTLLASAEFQQIVGTSANDLSHLIAALVQLHDLYRMKVYLVLVLVTLGLLLAFAGGPAA